MHIRLFMVRVPHSSSGTEQHGRTRYMHTRKWPTCGNTLRDEIKNEGLGHRDHTPNMSIHTRPFHVVDHVRACVCLCSRDATHSPGLLLCSVIQCDCCAVVNTLLGPSTAASSVSRFHYVRKERCSKEDNVPRGPATSIILSWNIPCATAGLCCRCPQATCNHDEPRGATLSSRESIVKMGRRSGRNGAAAGDPIILIYSLEYTAVLSACMRCVRADERMIMTETPTGDGGRNNSEINCGGTHARLGSRDPLAVAGPRPGPRKQLCLCGNNRQPAAD